MTSFKPFQDPRLLASSEILRAKKFKIHQELFRLPTGETHDRKTILHPGAIVVLPVTDSGKAILLRQYRYPLRRELLELCAGTLEEGEAPQYCAERELSEELGLQAKSFHYLGSFVTMPGFCDEKMEAFVAKGLSSLPGVRDEGELISSIEEFSAAEIDDAIRSGDLHDAKSITTIYLARLAGLF